MMRFYIFLKKNIESFAAHENELILEEWNDKDLDLIVIKELIKSRNYQNVVRLEYLVGCVFEPSFFED